MKNGNHVEIRLKDGMVVLETIQEMLEEQEITDIDYVKSLLDINGWYYIIALFLFIVLWALNKRLSAGILTGYVFLFLAVTVLSRSSTGEMRWEIVPFWSYRVTELREQILWNVICFIPIGICLGALLQWKGILVGIGISAVVELIQLISMRGLFEFDDIIHNSVGTVIGVVIYMTLKAVIEGVNHDI